MADDVRMHSRLPGQQPSSLLDLDLADEVNDTNAANAVSIAIPLDTNRPPVAAMAAVPSPNNIQFRFREPRIMFQNRSVLGRPNPATYFGRPRFGAGGNPGIFQRPLSFQGHGPSSFLSAGPRVPRHFRPLMSPRSNNF